MTKEQYGNKSKRVENIVSITENLAKIHGISSEEYDTANFIIGLISDICDEIIVDKSGNVIGKITAEKDDAKTIMLEAHMDQIGLMISGIDDDGFLKFTCVGGVDERILPSSDVVIFGKEKIGGVIFSATNSKDKNPEIGDLRIDTGLSAEKLNNLVKVGDLAVINGDFLCLNNTIYSGPAMDNRAGIAAVIDSVLNCHKSNYNIILFFSVQEELGLHGIYSGLNDISPDLAIIVDVTHGETSDTKGNTGVFPLGCGAVICKGPNFDFNYSKNLISLAKENDIPYAIEVASGPSGTDAWAIQIADSGIPCTLISIPLKYMHTNIETFDVSDVIAVADIITAVLEGGISID